MIKLQVGERYPHPEMVSQPGMGWHIDAGTILWVDDGLTAEQCAADMAGARMWLTCDGPLLVLLILVGRSEFEMPAWRQDELPEWAHEDVEGRLVFTNHRRGFAVAAHRGHQVRDGVVPLHPSARNRSSTTLGATPGYGSCQSRHRPFPDHLPDTACGATGRDRLDPAGRLRPSSSRRD